MRTGKNFTVKGQEEKDDQVQLELKNVGGS